MSLPTYTNFFANNSYYPIPTDLINIFQLNSSIISNPSIYSGYNIEYNSNTYDLSQIFTINPTYSGTSNPTDFYCYIGSIKYDLSKIFYPKSTIVTTNLVLYFDANNSASYPGSGITWFNLASGYTTYEGTLGTSGTYPLPSFNSTGIKCFNFISYYLGSTTPVGNKITLTSNPPNIGDDFTYCVWIKTTEVGYGSNHWNLMCIISAEISTKSNDFGFGINSSGYISYGDGKSSSSDITISSSTQVNTGIWTFVSVTRQKSSGQVVLYVNGVSVISGYCNSGNSVANTPILIGNESDYPSYSYGGSIAYVLGYTIVLTADQILQNYNSTKNNFA